MTIIFRLLLFSGCAVVLTLFMALVAPLFIDWERFRGTFEEEARQLLGQPVVVGGETNLRILPLPSISFSNVSIGEVREGEPLLTATRFQMKIELLPLLSGKVNVVDLALEAPRLVLSAQDDGGISFPQGEGRAVAADVGFEKVSIINGSVHIEDLPDNKTVIVEGISGILSAPSITGPWSSDLTGTWDGVPIVGDISTGTYRADAKEVRLRAKIRRRDRPYELVADGRVTQPQERLNWSGSFQIYGSSAQARQDDGLTAVPLPIGAEGIFSADMERLQISEYRLDVGEASDPYTISGKGKIELSQNPRFHFEADGRQIDLERLTDPQARQDQKENTPLDLIARFEGLKEILQQVPIPAMEGNVDIVLPAVTTGDTYIRDVAAKVSPANGGWKINDLRAVLPGNTQLEADGDLTVRLGDFGFSGNVVLASRQPSGFADWVSGRVDPTLRKISRFGVAGRVLVDETIFQINGMELRLDDALLEGSLTRTWPVGKEVRPLLKVDIAGDVVDFDNLRAVYSLSEPSNSQAMQAHDLSVSVSAGDLKANVLGQAWRASGVDADFQVSEATISVQRLRVQDLEGAAFEVSGTVENLLNAPQGQFNLGLEAQTLAPVFVRLQAMGFDNPMIARYAERASLTRNARLTINGESLATDQGSRGRIIANGTIQDSALTFSAGFMGEPTQPDVMSTDISLDLSNSNGLVLLEQIGLDIFKDPLVSAPKGAHSFTLSGEGALASGFELRGGLRAPDGNFDLAGMVRHEDGTMQGELQLSVASLDARPYAAALVLPIPQAAFARALPLSGSGLLRVSGPDLELQGLSGQVAGNTVAGSFLLQRSDVARPRLTGSLRTGRLAVADLGEIVLGAPIKRGEGVGKLNFTNSVLAGLDAQLDMHTDTLILWPGKSASQASGTLNMVDGALNLDSWLMSMVGGEVAGSIALSNTQGNAIMDLDYQFSGANAGDLVRSFGLGLQATGTVNASGSLEGTGRSVEGILGSLSGNGFAVVEELTLEGLNLNGFSSVLNAANQDDFQVTEEGVANLVDQHVLQGMLKTDRLEMAHSVTRGNFRVRNARFENPNASVVLGGLYDLSANELTGNLSVAFKPTRREQYDGGTPEITFSFSGTPGALDRTLDSAQLQGYLTLRAFERSTRRVENLEAQVMEKQRLQRLLELASLRRGYAARQEALREAVRFEAERVLREKERRRRQRDAEEAALREAERIRQREVEAKEAANARRLREAEEARAAQPLENQNTDITPRLNSGDPTPARVPDQTDIFDNIDEFLRSQSQ